MAVRIPIYADWTVELDLLPPAGIAVFRAGRRLPDCVPDDGGWMWANTPVILVVNRDTDAELYAVMAACAASRDWRMLADRLYESADRFRDVKGTGTDDLPGFLEWLFVLGNLPEP